eukprot:scaffold18997_cov101-Isochrysis_galbana.AAC.4
MEEARGMPGDLRHAPRGRLREQCCSGPAGRGAGRPGAHTQTQSSTPTRRKETGHIWARRQDARARRIGGGQAAALPLTLRS